MIKIQQYQLDRARLSSAEALSYMKGPFIKKKFIQVIKKKKKKIYIYIS